LAPESKSVPKPVFVRAFAPLARMGLEMASESVAATVLNTYSTLLPAVMDPEIVVAAPPVRIIPPELSVRICAESEGVMFRAEALLILRVLTVAVVWAVTVAVKLTFVEEELTPSVAPPELEEKLASVP
jgi:hypothetical protein